MTKPLTNRQITDACLFVFKVAPPDFTIKEDVEKLTEAIKASHPFLFPKDRHAIVLNTITRYVRYLLTEEDKNA